MHRFLWLLALRYNPDKSGHFIIKLPFIAMIRYFIVYNFFSDGSNIDLDLI